MVNDSCILDDAMSIKKLAEEIEDINKRLSDPNHEWNDPRKWWNRLRFKTNILGELYVYKGRA